MGKIVFWSMDRLALMITKMLLSKFDAFIVIEGNRGLGKSTLAYLLSRKVHNYFRKITKHTGGKESFFNDKYKFNPIAQSNNPEVHRYVLYKQQDVLDFMDRWHSVAIADEMINVAFNRDFWGDNQKNLIKVLNMNRDHCNLLVACVPQFQNLDNQIKNLTKIRITVIKRGMAVIQTPNQTFYIKDRWDSSNNEKVERESIRRKNKGVAYSKLNTFRGLIRFRKLNQKEQEIYDKIKISERNVIKTELGITDNSKKKSESFERAYVKLTNGAIRNMTELEGIAFAMGIESESLRRQFANRLKKEAKIHHVAQYFWEKPSNQKKKVELFA